MIIDPGLEIPAILYARERIRRRVDEMKGLCSNKYRKWRREIMTTVIIREMRAADNKQTNKQ